MEDVSAEVVLAASDEELEDAWEFADPASEPVLPELEPLLPSAPRRRSGRSVEQLRPRCGRRLSFDLRPAFVAEFVDEDELA